MRNPKLNSLIFSLPALVIFGYISCSVPATPPGSGREMKHEIEVIDTLLRDPSFAEFMSRSLDSAYYAGIGQSQPTFLTEKDDTGVQLLKLTDEKVATSIAGFYALECGVELLSKNSNETFISWLQKIVKGNAGSDAMLLLNRFANATWKAGQPFRDLERIGRYNFRVAGLLGKEETDKDSIQIINAANKLLPAMKEVAQGTHDEQMKFLRRLLQDTTFAVKMASYSDSAFAQSQHQTPPFLTLPPDTAMVTKTVKQVKIATSIAGFYALECGLNFLVTTKHLLPSKILQSLISGTLSTDDAMLFARFANATWKAGQPFRGLNRITRDTFTPFYFLSEADIQKDIVQVRAAAQIVLSRMENYPL